MDKTRSVLTKTLSKLKQKRTLSYTLIFTALCVTVFVIGIFAGAANVKSQAMAANKTRIEKGQEINLPEELTKTAIDNVLNTEAIPAYTTAEVMQMDVSKPSGVTLSDLKQVTRGALVGLEPAFLKAEKDYGINCLFVMAIASHESANGTMCYAPNNMFGYGGLSFSSKEECIDVVSKGLAQNYLREGAGLYSGKTISSVNKRYAASTAWDDKVAANMVHYYSVISPYHNKALEGLK